MDRYVDAVWRISKLVMRNGGEYPKETQLRRVLRRVPETRRGDLRTYAAEFAIAWRKVVTP